MCASGSTRCVQGEDDMRSLQVRVPDPQAPGFREEAHRQALLLRGAPEEREALDFIEAAADRGDAQT